MEAVYSVQIQNQSFSHSIKCLTHVAAAAYSAPKVRVKPTSI